MSHPNVFADPSTDLDVWGDAFGDVFSGERPVDPPSTVYRPLAIQDGTEYRPVVAAYGDNDYRPIYVAVGQTDYRPRNPGEETN